MKTPFIDTISIPEYRIDDSEPDFTKSAFPIVKWLRKYFPGKRVGLRLLSSQEHPKKSIEDLIDIILKKGHDRYDPNRQGDRYENLDKKKIDIFALDIQVGKVDENDSEEQVRHALESFFLYPKKTRGISVRIDIAAVYDLAKLEVVSHRYAGREDEVKTDGYVFKHPDKKPEAVLAILKIA